MITTDKGELSREEKLIRIEEIYKKMSKGELLEELLSVVNMLGQRYNPAGIAFMEDIHDSHFNQ